MANMVVNPSLIWFNLGTMSKICDICEKGYQRANLVPRLIGRRVSRRTTKKQEPNLRNKKMDIGGQTVALKICASCLKRLKFEKRKLAEVAEQEVSVTA